MLDSCVVVSEDEIKEQVNSLKGKIKEKDLEQIATTKKYGIKFLISLDRDFENFEEYLTPKQFLQRLNKKVRDSEF